MSAKKTLRIVHITPSLRGAAGGIATLVKQLMGQQRHDEDLNISYIEVAPPPGRNFVIKLFFALRAALLLLLVCCRPGKLIIHVHSACYGSLRRKSMLIRLGRMLGARAIMHFNGAVLDEWWEGSSVARQASIRKMLSTPDLIIAVSGYWRDYIAGLTRVPVVSISNAIEIADFGLEKKEEQNNQKTDFLTLLYLGVIGQRKGAFELLEAFRKALDDSSDPDLKLIMAGNGEIEKARTMVRDMKMSESVELPGWIGPDEKKRRLKEADIFVLPTHHEGLPLALIEAAASGLAIITTDASGIADTFKDGHTALIVSPGDVDALAATIIRLSKNPELRLGLSSAALEDAGRFDIKNICAQIKNIYSDLLVPHDSSTSG
jgi:glycosyltransferase involved in cell wall biosynthesis